MPPALAGRFLTTGPPGKSSLLLPLIPSSKPDYLPKVAALNTVPLEVPIQTYEFGGETFSPSEELKGFSEVRKHQRPWSEQTLVKL